MASDLSTVRRPPHGLAAVYRPQVFADPADGEALKRMVAQLIAESTCPDLVEDRGHLYGTKLPDADKRALIEFLKTL